MGKFTIDESREAFDYAQQQNLIPFINLDDEIQFVSKDDLNQYVTVFDKGLEILNNSKSVADFDEVDHKRIEELNQAKETIHELKEGLNELHYPALENEESYNALLTIMNNGSEVHDIIQLYELDDDFLNESQEIRIAIEEKSDWSFDRTNPFQHFTSYEDLTGKSKANNIDHHIYFYTGFNEPQKININDTKIKNNLLGDLTDEVIEEYNEYKDEPIVDWQQNQYLASYGIWVAPTLENFQEYNNSVGLDKSEHLGNFKGYGIYTNKDEIEFCELTGQPFEQGEGYYYFNGQKINKDSYEELIDLDVQEKLFEYDPHEFYYSEIQYANPLVLNKEELKDLDQEVYLDTDEIEEVVAEVMQDIETGHYLDHEL